ncbi:MAG: hypothetical protein LPK09_08900 [Hymenobacteraceae bacterium]|nr:hypothetical protein [Hymenobacteraceae bacterium]
MKIFIRYYLVLVTLLLSGCQDEVCKDLEIVEATANLVWSGDYALDGCGYSVQIGEQRYKPDNEEDIDESFKAKEIFEGTVVKLKYIPQGKRDFQCGMLPAVQTLDFIRIISIKKI